MNMWQQWWCDCVPMASSSNSKAGSASTLSSTDVTGLSSRESSEYKSELLEHSDPGSHPVLSILDRLQVPTKSELARNCCVAINLSQEDRL